MLGSRIRDGGHPDCSRELRPRAETHHRGTLERREAGAHGRWWRRSQAAWESVSHKADAAYVVEFYLIKWLLLIITDVLKWPLLLSAIFLTKLGKYAFLLEGVSRRINSAYFLSHLLLPFQNPHIFSLITPTENLHNWVRQLCTSPYKYFLYGQSGQWQNRLESGPFKIALCLWAHCSPGHCVIEEEDGVLQLAFIF